LFISLHANGSASAALRGWQVQSLDATDYAGGPGALPATSSAQTVPIVGGGTRVIDTVLWHLAQLPHAERSASLAELLSARLAESGLPSQPVPVVQAPLRVLVGANMPAVLIELGFLTHGEDAAALATPAFQNAVAGVIAGVIGELRSGWPAAGGGDR
jgi:N-acetylmuramoyl-L-alanine amidase